MKPKSNVLIELHDATKKERGFFCIKLVCHLNNEAQMGTEDYGLIGTQADQKKFIGNAVEVTIARKWCEALCAELHRLRTKQTA